MYTLTTSGTYPLSEILENTIHIGPGVQVILYDTLGGTQTRYITVDTGSTVWVYGILQ